MPDHFLLQWDEHTSSVMSAFAALRRNSLLVDVTLAADGRSLQAHKVVLCANSPYFEELLSSNPCKHPIVYMKDVDFDNLSAILDFMYNGVVYVGRKELPDVIKVGNSLQVRGIAGVNFNSLCETEMLHDPSGLVLSAPASAPASVAAAAQAQCDSDGLPRAAGCASSAADGDRVKRRRVHSDHSTCDQLDDSDVRMKMDRRNSEIALAGTPAGPNSPSSTPTPASSSAVSSQLCQSASGDSHTPVTTTTTATTAAAADSGDGSSGRGAAATPIAATAVCSDTPQSISVCSSALDCCELRMDGGGGVGGGATPALSSVTRVSSAQLSADGECHDVSVITPLTSVRLESLTPTATAAATATTRPVDPNCQSVGDGKIALKSVRSYSLDADVCGGAGAGYTHSGGAARSSWLNTGGGAVGARSRRGGGRLLQRQTRVKRDGAEPPATAAAAAGASSPAGSDLVTAHSPGPLAPQTGGATTGPAAGPPATGGPALGSLEVPHQLESGAGVYLTVAPVVPRQMSAPAGPAARALVKQGSAPAPGSHYHFHQQHHHQQHHHQQHQYLSAAAGGAGGMSLQKQHSTPSNLQLATSGTTFYMVASSNPSSLTSPTVTSQSAPSSACPSSSPSYLPLLVEQRSGPLSTLPQIMLTSADDPCPVPLSAGGGAAPPPASSAASGGAAGGAVVASRSHTPSLRDGPAVSCSHCWNTEYSQGRTIRRKTKYMCRDCAVSLCIVPCFQEYHEVIQSATDSDPCGSTQSPRLTASKKLLPKVGSI